MAFYYLDACIIKNYDTVDSTPNYKKISVNICIVILLSICILVIDVLGFIMHNISNLLNLLSFALLIFLLQDPDYNWTPIFYPITSFSSMLCIKGNYNAL